MQIQEQRTEAMLRNALENGGFRCTEQRTAVFRALCDTAEHPTADQVWSAVRPGLPDISLATVYKALETLVGCGLAAKLTYGDGSARYDARMDDHVHSRCLDCGAVRDVAPGPLALDPAALAVPGFQVLGCRVEIIGRCHRCEPSRG